MLYSATSRFHAGQETRTRWESGEGDRRPERPIGGVAAAIESETAAAPRTARVPRECGSVRAGLDRWCVPSTGFSCCRPISRSAPRCRAWDHQRLEGPQPRASSTPTSSVVISGGHRLEELIASAVSGRPREGAAPVRGKDYSSRTATSCTPLQRPANVVGRARRARLQSQAGLC